MPAERTCSQCGAPLPANAPGSRCPKCLLALAIEDTGGDSEEATLVPGNTVELTQSDFGIEQTGTMIGRYKLLQQIGEGGFGIVFMAEQTEPVQRKVALKIIKAGMDSREVIARFEAERQALALMDHPNIAQVLDGGTTTSGRPYFVMELVRGVPITAYCDQANLSTRERLELFIKVCRAVQHAHQKGVIHRDLKPSNVLVTLHDGEPVPKVIDFGVAKALGQKLTDKTLFTRFEQMIGTPAYMSPEQAALSGLDIDTRSDVYSLGALLYELLSGVTPLDAQTLREAALDEIRRMIQETEPPKPSTRVATLGERLADVARCRHADPASLTRLIRGDLDWITMKALEKDRRRRYETVNGLAADLERHLRDEPVVARPPSPLYRLQKVARRHRVAFAAGTAVFMALVLGLVISIWQAVRAIRAEKEQSRLGNEEKQQRRRAEDNANAADRNAAESRSRLVRQYVANGTRLVEERDLLGALPWFAKALQEEQADPARAEIHRLRLGTTLQQCPRLVQAWFCKDWVHHAALSPDGRWVVIAGNDGVSRVWDAGSGEPISPPLRQEAPVTKAVFSPDGQRVASTAAGGGTAVREARTGRLLFPLLRGGTGVQFSPDGSRLLIIGGTRAHLFDASTGAQVGAAIEQSFTWSCTFSPDGRRILITGDDGTARVWDGLTGLPLTDRISYVGIGNTPDFSGPNRIEHVAEFSPEGNRFALACGNRVARICDVATGKDLVAIPHRGIVRCVRFSPDGRWLVTACNDGTAQVWDATTGIPVSPPLKHRGPVMDVGFSPDGRFIVSASTDGTARVWEAATGRQVAPAMQHAGTAGLASFSPDGARVLTVGNDNTVRVWEWRGTGVAYSAMKLPAVVQSATFSSKGERVITASLDGRARVWDLGIGKPSGILESNLEAVRKVQFSPDGHQLVVALTNGSTRVWDLATGQPASPALTHTGLVNHLEFSADGARLVTGGSDRMARVWEVATGRLISEMKHRESVNYVTFTPDSKEVVTVTLSVPESFQLGDARTFDPIERTAITANWSQAQQWNAETGQPLGPPVKLGLFASHVSFSPDRRRALATCSARGLTEKQAWIVDVVTGQRLAQPLEHDKGLIHGVFSPDGKWAVTTSWDHTARVWDAATAQPIGPRLRHQSYVYFAAFSPDSRLVATASADHTARVWDAATGEPVTPPLKHSAAVNRVIFGPDARVLLAASSDGEARAWHLAKAKRSVEDEVLLAQMLAGHRVDETDAVLPITTDAMADAWTRLRAQFSAGTSAASQLGVARESRSAEVEGEFYVPGEDSEASLSSFYNPYREQMDAVWSQVNHDRPYPPTLTPAASNQLAGFLAVSTQAIEAEPNPQHGGYYMRRAYVYERLGEYQKAINDMREWFWRIGPISTRSFLVKMYLMLGRSYWMLGEKDNAEIYLRAAEESSAEDASACDFLARSYASGPTNFVSFQKALPLALKAIELSNTNLSCAATLADIYSRMGQPEKAADLIEKALELHPNSGAQGATVFNNLAWNCVAGSKAIESAQKALPLALKAVELSRTNYNELNTLGVVYYRLGQLTNAIQTLETGIKSDGAAGGTAHDFFFLAMSYQRRGDAVKAREYFARAEKWIADQPSLPAEWKAEFDAFRAEAEEVLGKPKPK